MKTRKGEPVIVVPEEQQQIVDLERQLAAERKEHLETREKLKKAETELRRWRGCPSCKEDHDDSVMCPPHEVRTSGRAWFHTQARKWAERAEQAEAERDELQRKLDACQCETRVLNESLLIEARQERDQLAAEAARLREVLEMIATIKLNESDPAFIGICPMRIGLLRPTHMSKVKEALAAAPQAAKAAERVKVMETALRAAHHELTTLHGLWACDNFDVYDKALTDGCDHNAAWERFCDEMWQIDTALPIEQIDGALSSTPHAAKAAERVQAMENVVNEARAICNLMEALTREGNELAEVDFAAFAELCTAIDALDKPEVQDNGGFMERITVVCDRCGSSVDGLEEEGVGTGGFYRRPGWGQYMNEGENTICDACMQSDARYRAAQ